MKTILGIDPGKVAGFFACLSDNGIRTWPMPVLGRHFDIHAIKQIMIDAEPDLVVIERQQTHGEGAKKRRGKAETPMTAFSVGLGYGILQGLVVAMNLRYQIVEPKVWQKEMLMGIQGDDTKKRSIIAAKQLFPGISMLKSDSPNCKNDHDGKSDALLIAEYGRRHFL